MTEMLSPLDLCPSLPSCSYSRPPARFRAERIRRWAADAIPPRGPDEAAVRIAFAQAPRSAFRYHRVLEAPAWPACLGPLVELDHSLRLCCRSCEASYAVEHGMSILLTEDSRCLLARG